MEYSEKQIQILSTAEKLFSSKGYDGTSVRDIAEAAGVNLAMISYYFGSKEKLMEALFDQRSNNIKLKVDNLLQNDALTPMEKVEHIADEYLKRVMDKQQFYKIMICEQVINKNPAIIELIHDMKRRNTEALQQLIEDGQQKGVFKQDVDTILLINTMIGTITQVLITIDYYKEYNQLQHLPEDEFFEQTKQKLSKHIKLVLKALLTYEA